MAGSSNNRPSLTILGGPMAGKQLVLEEGLDNVLIGSDPSCGFHLPLPGVSPIHARLSADEEGVTIYDVNSPRGLYVNDDRVAGQAPLRNGDILWLGAPGDTDVVMIQCRVPPRAQAVAPPPPAEPALQTFPEPTFEVRPEEPAMAEPTVAQPPSGFDVLADEFPTVYEVAPEEASAPAYYVPPPPAPAPPPIPAFFEDETVMERPAEPPIPPPAPAEVETVAMPPPAPPAPEPTIAAPPPPPAPRVEAKPAPPPPPAAPAETATPAPRPRPAPAAKAERPPRPAAPPAEKAVPPPRPKASSPVALYAGLAAAGVLVVGGGIFAAMRFLKPSPGGGTTPTTVAAVALTTLPPTTVAAQPTAPPPTTEAAKPPEPVEEAVTIVKQKPTPAPSPKVADAGTSLKPTAAPPTLAAKPTPPPPTQAKGPSPEELKAQQAAAQVADLLGQADAALVGHKYDAAAGLYDQALKLDPQNAKAGAGRTAALAGATTMKKTFVAGRTTVQSGKTSKGGVSGFDDADVSVAKAPDYSGRIEFEASPRNVKPGDSYTVKVYLVNDGKKSFKIGGLTIAMTVNGARASGGPVTPPAKDVEPQGRVLLQEVPGVWQDAVNTWSQEVVVTSNHGDTFKNQLTWR